jgi:hypothetical protein
LIVHVVLKIRWPIEPTGLLLRSKGWTEIHRTQKSLGLLTLLTLIGPLTKVILIVHFVLFGCCRKIVDRNRIDE